MNPSSYDRSDYYADPKRSVHVRGEIDQGLIDRLAPLLLELQESASPPITVYIDSPGGEVRSARALLRLLRAPRQDGSPRCRILTVGSGYVASAAADLLSRGDYALIYPGTTVHVHGSRYPLRDDVTEEEAIRVTEALKESNSESAYELAEWCFGRFLHVCFYLLSERSEDPVSERTEESAHQTVARKLKRKLGRRAQKILSTAVSKYEKYQEILSKIETSGTQDRNAEWEAAVFQGILKFHLDRERDPTWSLARGGLRQVTNDFYYLAYQRSPSSLATDRIWEPFLRDLGSEQKTLWQFYLALCHSMHEGENQLSATDGFWLGLVDEVIGDVDLPKVRLLVEEAAKIA